VADSPAEAYLDASLLHQVRLARFSSGLAQKIIEKLDDLDLRLLGSIKPQPSALSRLEERAQIRAREIIDELESELREFAHVERRFQIDLLLDRVRNDEEVSNVILGQIREAKPLEVYAGVLAAQMPGSTGGRPVTLGEIRQTLIRKIPQTLTNTVKLGYTQGLSEGQISQRLRGTPSLRFRDGVREADRRALRNYVDTDVNSIMNYVRNTLYKDVKSVDRILWITKLEAGKGKRGQGTCAVCASLSGRVFYIDTKAAFPSFVVDSRTSLKVPSPPIHLACKCHTVPLLEGEDPNGIMQAADADGEEWLRRIDEKWEPKSSANSENNYSPIEAALGKKAARIFRDGRVPLDRFIDYARNDTLTLDELVQSIKRFPKFQALPESVRNLKSPVRQQ
jgi:hypothetical protein